MKKKFTFLIAAVMLLMMMSLPGKAVGQSTTYTTGTLPSGWTASGGDMTMNGISWAYSSATYLSLNNSKLQIGSKNNPQTTAWTIQTAISNFGSGKKVTAVSITAYTTATTATYDISVGGTSVKSGSLTTSSSEYSASSLNVTSGNVVITMTGSNSSKAMYLSNISVTYEDAGPVTYTVTYDCNDGTSGCPTENPSGLSSGDHITLAAAPIKTGYTFAGWNDGTTTYSAGDEYTVTGNVTMTAQWTANTHNVIVTGANHGTVTGFTNPVAYNTVVTLTYTHNDGQYYSATFSTSDASIYGSDNNKFIMPDKDVTITVTETALPTYTVTYSDGGSVTEVHYGAGVTLATRDGAGAYSFAGWTTSNIATETTTTPDPILTGTYHPTRDITLYPIYTRSEGGGTVWQKITDFSTVTDGTYALITSGGKAFNGTITNGRGGATANAFEFTNDEALSAPEGTCELTLTTVDGGFTIKNSSNKFLYIKAASEGNLAWNDSENSYWYDYLSYSSHYLRYNANNAYLRSYNDQFRTYSGMSNGAVCLVKKATSTTYYYVSTPSSISVPTFDPTSQNFSTANLSVTISAESGCVIKYTTDDWEHETETTSNTVTIEITGTTIVKAKAKFGNDFSAEVSHTYTKVYNVTLSSNGVVVGTPIEVVSGESTKLAAPSNIPNGYSFRGWTAIPATPSGLVNNTYTPNANVTLYAVFGKNIYGDFAKVVLAGDVTSGNYLIVYNNTYAFDTHYGKTNANTYATYTNISSYYNNNTIEYNPTTANLIVVVAQTANGYSIYDTDGYLGNINNSNGAQLRWDTDFTENQNEWTIGVGSIVSCKNNTKAIRWNNASGDERFAIYGTTGQQAITLYKLQVVSTDGYYIRVYPTNTTAQGPITITGPTVIESGSVLNMNGQALTNGTAANLIIEDGAQLITTSSNVAATVKKNITGVGAENWAAASGAAGWYFVASPVNGANFSTATVDDDYDLYMLDWAEKWWRNIRKPENASIFNAGFQRGTGYLYAHKDDHKLSFAGIIQPLSDDNNAQVELTTEGWNLIGNPLTCNVTVSCGFDELVNASGVTSKNANSVIKPCQGIAVWGSAGDKVTFTKADAQNAAAPSNSSIQMALAQNIVTRGSASYTTIDNAIISFNKSKGLPKFNLFESNANLYIPMDNEEYAIVSSSAQGEMPVNFRAYVTGEYTITVNPQEVEMGYLHLIDNIAGVDVDLLANPSYTFNARYDDYESRFRLVFSANMVNADLNDDFAFFSNGQLVIANEGEAILQVIDVNGRIIGTESINGTCSKAINAKAGVYVLRLINGTDVKTQKIIVK